MKKLFVVLLMLISVCCVAVFANGTSESKVAPETKSPEGQVFTLKYATNGMHDPVLKNTEEIFLDEIEKNSNGSIKVERYINGELVQSAEDLLALLESNGIQAASESDMSMSWVAPEWISYTSIPFCFRNQEHMHKFFMGEIGKEINKRISEQHHYHFLDSEIGMRGGRMITANKPIRTPDDMKGLKFRVPNVIGTVASWTAMGAKVVGVPLSELFTSLQNGLVDGEENPYAQIDAVGLYQVQKYIMETRHQFNPMVMYVNDEFYNSLPKDLQQVLLDANKKAWDAYNKGILADEDRIREKVKAAGVTIIPASEIDVDAFKKRIEDKVLNSDTAKGWAKDGWKYIQSIQ